MRIVLPFCRDVVHGFYRNSFQGLSEAIRELGHEPVRFVYARIGELQPPEMQALHRLLDSGSDFVLDLCCWGYALSQIGVPRPDAPPTPVLDAFGLRYVGMLFDQPYFQPINAVRARLLYATFPDRGHPAQAKFAFPELVLSGHAFVPPAVRPRSDCAAREWAERDIDVLYFGNLDPAVLGRPWTGSAAAPLYDAVADLALERPDRTLLANVTEVLRRQAAPPSTDAAGKLIGGIELFTRAKFRHDAVTALADSGVGMRIVGRGWDRVALPRNAECSAEVPYEEMFRLAGRAKICLDASTYLNGANDRIFAYALNGAVSFTNAGGYLREAVGAVDCVQFYSLRELRQLASQVSALLQQPQRLREASVSAQRFALAAHTWRHRLEGILTAVQ